MCSPARQRDAVTHTHQPTAAPGPGVVALAGRNLAVRDAEQQHFTGFQEEL